MANAADWLNAGRGPGLARPEGRAAMRRSPLRHPPAELGSTAPNPSGEIPRESSHWESRADLSNEINERDLRGKPIPCNWKPF